ncbi:MAG: FAD-binding protein [Thermomicrobiales bacterium]|nr:FAD-binding protein [Thermomicrobiales bacterium]
MATDTNWAGTYTFRANRIHHPQSIDEARKLVASAPKIRGLGTKHSFHDIADTVELVSLDRVDPAISVDHETMTASAGASLRYGELARELHEAGVALHNMGSLPHISIGGATATATHGSGNGNRNLSSAVCGLEFITSEGEVLQVDRSHPDFDGMVVHLGGLGLVTRLTFDVQPTYDVCQEVLEDLPWEALLDDPKAVFGSGYSVSIFTRFKEPTAGLLWRKHRLTEGWDRETIDDFGARRATVDRHPVDGFSGAVCTPQLLQPGPWCDRLPYFDLDQIPATGAEIQSEYMIDMALASEALAALKAFEPRLSDALMVSELRTIAADDLWLSTAYQRDTIGLHFTWHKDPAKVEAAVPEVEALLAPFAPRAHWGKVFQLDAAALEQRYPRCDDFRQLRRRFDPRGVFANPFLERVGLV